ncbi:MAG: hypothetical protein ACO1NS_12380 [Daejeonella sp.]
MAACQVLLYRMDHGCAASMLIYRTFSIRSHYVNVHEQVYSDKISFEEA